MPVLIVLMVLVGALCILDLILTVGVVKRLREHTELLTAPPPTPAVEVGERVGPFAATTVTGSPLGPGDFVGETLVAFFSPTCKPCKEKLPDFLRYAKAPAPGEERPVAVVVGDPGQAEDFVSRLAPTAQVVVEPPDGAMGIAFKAEMYPTMFRVAPADDGTLIVTDNAAELEHPKAATATTPVPAR
ncbi:TlpA disulfide reductase family protein [Streptomyces goshikiensis]|uniref:TlpA disulfide reductase family protein n=1 Tax=Streptomyces goshikiensis TaxID=1942 RepID=UPI003654A4C4